MDKKELKETFNSFDKLQQKKDHKDFMLSFLRATIKGNLKGRDLAKNSSDLFRFTSYFNDRKKISDDEHKRNIENLLKNLEEKEKQRALNLINKLEKTYQTKMVHITDIYTKDELDQLNKIKQIEKEIIKTTNGYKWKNYILPISVFEPKVFYYNHGLDLIKDLQYVDGKSIIDAGAYIADSALMFRQYFKKSEIHCFESTKSNCALAQKTIKLNNLTNIKIVNLGLGDENITLKVKTSETNLKSFENSISDIGNENISMTTLDSYVKENNLKVGLIKTDVEGFEPKLLDGAKETIFNQKPILLISIYHNYNDFYKIKPMIESWNLGYKFDFFQGVQNSGDIVLETMLIAQN